MIAATGVLAPAAATAAGIMVRLAGGERHFSPDEIDAAVDRPAGSYLLRARDTTAEPVAHPPALSMRRLVILAGASPDAVSFMTIERPNGTLAVLKRPDLADPPSFPEGPPIVWMDAGATRYLRPVRDSSDVNATDNIGVTEGDLAVRIHHGPLLAVRARADQRHVRPGEPVSLTAQVIGATKGEALAFDWSFGDGTGKPGRAVHHRFRTPGVYETVVTVNGADDSGGSSAPLRIRVGRLPKDAGETGGGTGDRQRSPANGPARGGGTGGGARSGRVPDRTGPSSPSSEPEASARKSQGGPRQRAETPRPVGTVIRGTLVASRTAAALAIGAAARSGGAQAAARRGSDPDPDSLPPAAGFLVVGVLLWLGSRRERRELRRRPGLAS